jgi:lipoate---protein ligase
MGGELLVSRTYGPYVNRTQSPLARRFDLHPPRRLCENDAMLRLMLTLDSPAENIALDEALVDEAEALGPAAEYLRIWEAPSPLVVLGRSSKVADEVDVAACRGLGIPILRRTSGGAAIVAGPGCLMYAVVLSYDRRPEARGIPASHAHVLDRLAAGLQSQAPNVSRAGTSDLVLVGSGGLGAARKFSGNSLRVKRTHFLYHGTLLYDFDLALVAECLRTAPRQPEYREQRNHLEFVTNLPLARTALETALTSAWPTHGEATDWPRGRVEELVRERYSRDDWNLA